MIFSISSCTRTRAALPSGVCPPSRASFLPPIPTVAASYRSSSSLTHCFPHMCFAPTPPTSSATVWVDQPWHDHLRRSLPYKSCAATAVESSRSSFIILAKYVQYLGSRNMLSSGFTTGTVTTRKYTRIMADTRVTYSSIVSCSSLLMRYPMAFVRSSSFHGVPSASDCGITLGTGHPPDRCTSFANKMSGNAGNFSKRLAVTSARGAALFFFTVTSISACSRMAFAKDESEA